MPHIQSLSRDRRPAEYHGRHTTQTDVLMNVCPDDYMPTGGGKGMARPSNNGHVMLVQRRAVELQVMAEILSLLGYRITAVEESGKALLYFGRAPCELVISELDMPQLNGFQLARRIRKRSPQTRILMMTACCQAEVVNYMDGRVVDGWLFKPFRLEVLKNMLDGLK